MIIAEPTAPRRRRPVQVERTGPAPVLPDGIAELLDDASPAEDAATDAAGGRVPRRPTRTAPGRDVAGRPDEGTVQAIRRRQSRVTSPPWQCSAGAMKEARIGLYPAQRGRHHQGMFLDAVAKPPASGEQGAARTGAVARSEFDGILAWAVGQAVAADPDEVQARVDKEMLDNWAWTDSKAETNGSRRTAAKHRCSTSARRNGAGLTPNSSALEYVVDAIIPEGLGLLVAPPKKGKSFLVGNVGLAVAAAESRWGHPCHQRPVLYLALEDGHRRLQDRFRRILGGRRHPRGDRVVIKASPNEALRADRRIHRSARRGKPLVILDTLGKVKPPKGPGRSPTPSTIRRRHPQGVSR